MITIQIPTEISENERGILVMLATIEEMDEEGGIHLTKYMDREVMDAISHLLDLGLIESEQIGDTKITRGYKAGQSRNDGIDIYRITEKSKQMIHILKETQFIKEPS